MSRGREDLGGTQVEGRQAVRELLRAERRQVRQIMVAEGSERGGTLGEILDLAAAHGVGLRWVGRDHLDSVALSDAHQGVVARADPVPIASLDELVAAERPFLVILDGVTDPHNMGAILRSALSAGATGVVISRHAQAGLTAAALKAAAGAAEYLPIALVAGIPATLASLTAAGVWTVGLDGGAATSVWDLAVADEAVALVLGAEGRGLGRLVAARCDLLVRIPLQGPLDSLNVAAAAALACFEVARRRRTS